MLALVAEKPIYPLFFIRAGYRRYRILALEPIVCLRSGQSREEDVAAAMQRWAVVLEEVITEYWPQWFAFTPVFQDALATKG